MAVLTDEQLSFKLPGMYRIRQSFPRPVLDDIEGRIAQEFLNKDISGRVRPGARVAVAVGSRGIKNIARIVKAVILQLKCLGAEPFIISAMGSHGGGTPEGQRAVLTSYGITEEAMGVPVVTSVDVTHIGRTSRGIEVYFDSTALAADLVVPINRVKLHTAFVGDVQSGLCKMLVIGLGNQVGCSSVHRAPLEIFAETLIEAAQMIMARAKVGFGVAVLENAYDETMMIEAVPAERIIAREKELVDIAKRNMPSLLIKDIDVLIVEEIGKNISGSGADPNVTGRSFLLKKFMLSVPRIQRMVLLDVTEESHGNALGIGLFEVITRRVLDKIDLPTMYANAIASKSPETARIPITAESDEEAVRFAIQMLRGVDKERLKIVRIKNTLALDVIEVSEALLDQVKADNGLTLLSLTPLHEMEPVFGK